MTNITGTWKLIKSGIKSVNTAQHDAGFEHETNDCFVQALKAVTGVPYRDAHAFCRTRFHRADRQGTKVHYMRDIATEGCTIFGYRVFMRIAPMMGARRFVSRDSYGMRTLHTRPRYQTLAQFTRSHRTGRWICWSNSHAFAIIDGVVYDNGAAGARTQVTGCYELIPSSQCHCVAPLPKA